MQQELTNFIQLLYHVTPVSSKKLALFNFLLSCTLGASFNTVKK